MITDHNGCSCAAKTNVSPPLLYVLMPTLFTLSPPHGGYMATTLLSIRGELVRSSTQEQIRTRATETITLWSSTGPELALENRLSSLSLGYHKDALQIPDYHCFRPPHVFPFWTPSSICYRTFNIVSKRQSGIANGLITVPFQQTEAQSLEQRSAVVQPSFSGYERDPAS